MTAIQKSYNKNRPLRDRTLSCSEGAVAYLMQFSGSG